MRSNTMLKILGVCAVSSLSLIGGVSRADGCMSQALSPAAGAYGPGGCPSMNQIDVRLAQEMARIEAGLRTGQITPYQAGRLMRERWEWAQFQRGFLGAGHEPERGGSCALNQDVVSTLAPLVANMAKDGIQTASSVMRALAHEASRLLREPPLVDDLPPL